jgi:hypothetical protein
LPKAKSRQSPDGSILTTIILSGEIPRRATFTITLPPFRFQYPAENVLRNLRAYQRHQYNRGSRLADTTNRTKGKKETGVALTKGLG